MSEHATAPVVPSIRVLFVPVGLPPEVRHIHVDEQGSHLAAMQSLVGGYVECIHLEDYGIDAWCNDDATGLSPNWEIPATAPEVPEDFELITVDADEPLALPGSQGVFRIHGDFFLVRSTPDGELADVTDEDVTEWMERWSNARRVVTHRPEGA